MYNGVHHKFSDGQHRLYDEYGAFGKKLVAKSMIKNV